MTNYIVPDYQIILWREVNKDVFNEYDPYEIFEEDFDEVLDELEWEY